MRLLALAWQRCGANQMGRESSWSASAAEAVSLCLTVFIYMGKTVGDHTVYFFFGKKYADINSPFAEDGSVKHCGIHSVGEPLARVSPQSWIWQPREMMVLSALGFIYPMPKDGSVCSKWDWNGAWLNKASCVWVRAVKLPEEGEWWNSLQPPCKKTAVNQFPKPQLLTSTANSGWASSWLLEYPWC